MSAGDWSNILLLPRIKRIERIFRGWGLWILWLNFNRISRKDAKAQRLEKKALWINSSLWLLNGRNGFLADGVYGFCG